MRKLLLTLIALLALGVSGAWADVTVTISDQTDLETINSNNVTSETVHKYGTYSSGTGGKVFTTNTTSGQAGLTVTSTTNIIKPSYYTNNKYLYSFTVTPASGYNEVNTVTISAPNGYYIKSYSMKAISTSDKGQFTVTPFGGTATNVSTDQVSFSVSSASNIASFTVVRNTGTNNATELCIPFFTVTLAEDGTYTSSNILYSTGTFSRTDGKTSTNSNNTWNSTLMNGLKFTSNYNSMGKATVSGTDYTCLHSGYSPTYTITAPDGYYVAGYSMNVFAQANQNIKIDGVSQTLSTDSSAPTQINVNGINAKTTSFQRTGESDGWAYLTNFTVYLIPTYSVTYYIKDNESHILSTKIGTVARGTLIIDLQDQFKLDYCSYTTTPTTIMTNSEIDVTCTWDFPFEIASTYGDAHWYDMSVRSTWYVTSDNVEDGTGALKTVNANALGLATDPYQWAFVGDPYNLKIYNKDKGEDFVYAWTAAANQNVPSFVDASTGNSWTIKASTADGYTNAFQLTIPDYGYQVNQFGGEGGSLKIWNSTVTSDAGSAFKVFDVPDDFAEYVTSEIAPYMENTATYFNWTDAARTTIGYDASYKTSCTYTQYANMKTALTSALEDLNSNVTFPEPGYYRIKNRLTTDSYGYMGLNGGTELLGNISNTNDVSTIIHLTKSGSKYYFQTQGKYTSQVRQNDYVSLLDATPTEAFDMQVQAIGYAAFRTWEDGPNSYYHTSKDKDYKIVGWEHTANASQWSIEDANSVTLTLNEVDGVTYGTTYLPFGVTLPDGDVYAYTLTDLGNGFVRPELLGSGKSIPAETAVLLKGTSTTSVEATITDVAAINQSNILNGTYTSMTPGNNLVLGKYDGAVGFYKYSYNIKANKAYIPVTDPGVKGLAISWDFTDGISEIGQTGNSQSSNSAIYNLAGQRMGKLQRGVNIVNGKKVLVK